MTQVFPDEDAVSFSPSGVLAKGATTPKTTSRAAFLLLFFLVAGHTLFETTRDVLFLERMKISELPWMYLVLAGVSIVQGVLPKARLTWLDPRVRVGAGLLLGIATALFFFLFGRSLGRPGFIAMYLWSAYFGSLAVSEAWLLIGRNVAGIAAKQQVTGIGLGGILGAIAGSSLARLLIGPQPRLPLLFAAILFGLAAASVIPLTGRTEARKNLTPSTLPLQRAVRDRYLLTLALISVLAYGTLTFLDFTFKQELTRNLDDASRARTLSTVALVANVASAVLQIGLARVGVRIIGTAGLVAILPLVLLGAGVGWAASGRMLFLVLAKICDGSMRFSVQRTAMELLFLPVGDTLRARVKPLFDVGLQRGAQALASLAILLTLAWATRVHYAWAIVACSALWLATAFALRGNYKRLFEQALRSGVVRAGGNIPLVDSQGVQTLVASLGSDRDAEVFAALDLLEEQGHVRLIPSLLLYHPSGSVVRRGIEIFLRWQRVDGLPALRHVLRSADPRLRAAALRAITVIRFDEALARKALEEDDSAEVKAAALVCMVTAGVISTEEARAYPLDRTNIETGKAFLRAIREMGDEKLAPALHHVATLERPDLELELAEAMAHLARPEFIPYLVKFVAKRRTREAAREGLVAIGRPALDALEQAVFDPEMPRDVAVHAPRSIARFASEDAVRRLLRIATEHHEGIVRYKAIRGLGGIIARAPRMRVERSKLWLLLRRNVEEIRTVQRLYGAFAATQPHASSGELHAILEDYLKARRHQAWERFFRLIALRFPFDDIYRIHVGVLSDDRDLRTSSIELLDTILPGPLRVLVQGLLDALTEAVVPTELPPSAELLGEIRVFGSGTARDLAVAYARAANVPLPEVVAPESSRPGLEYLLDKRVTA